MKNFAFRTFALSAILGCLLVSSPASAQETTAGGTLDTQASWTALQNMLSATNGNVSLLRTDVNAMKTCAATLKMWQPGKGCVDISDPDVAKIIACGKQGKVYGSGTAGADGNGCVTMADNSLRWSEGVRQMKAAPHTIAYMKELSKAKDCRVYGGTDYGDGDSSIVGQRCSTLGTKCSVSHYGNCSKKEGQCTTHYTCD